MFLVYVDDSGDEHYRCFSALLVHESVWRQHLDVVKAFRRNLKLTDGIFVTKELHATEFTAGRGRLGDQIVPKGRRCEIFRMTLRLIADLPKLQMINCIAPRGKEKQVFERLVNRIHRCMAEWKSRAIIFHDEGKDYTTLIRRMGVYNPSSACTEPGRTAHVSRTCPRHGLSRTSYSAIPDDHTSFR